MITYAQNLEDVVLNRVFNSKPNGFYIDVGAHDPEELSVTKFFYDLGWKGINIEPIPSSYAKFIKARPRDINLNIGIGTERKEETIYSLRNSPEYASMDYSIIKSSSEITGKEIEEYKIEIDTLKSVCEQHIQNHEIDFLKIDVEGWEKLVIESADWEHFRPTLLVIEATKAMGAIITDWNHPDKAATWPEWEQILIDANYDPVFYDGMNQFYLKRECYDLKKYFHIPMTPIQDNFIFADHKRLKISSQSLQKEINSLKSEKDSNYNEKTLLLEKQLLLEKEIISLKNQNNNLNKSNNAVSIQNKSLLEKQEILNAECIRLKKENNTLNKANISFSIENKLRKEKLVLSENESNILKKEMSSFKIKHEITQNNNIELKENIESLKKKNQTDKAKCEYLENKINSFIIDNESTKRISEIFNKANETSNKIIESLKKENHYNKVKTEYFKNKINSFIIDYNTLNSLQSIIHQIFKASNKIIKTNKFEFNLLEDKYQSLSKKYKKLNLDYTVIKNNFDPIQTQIQTLLEKNTELNKLNVLINKTYKLIEYRYHLLSIKIEEKEQKNQETLDIKQKIEKQLIILENKLSESKKIRITLEKDKLKEVNNLKKAEIRNRVLLSLIK